LSNSKLGARFLYVGPESGELRQSRASLPLIDRQQQCAPDSNIVERLA
jgi:hypothetical protein